MAGGLFTRIKNWVQWETLTHSDLNAEIDNVKAKMDAEFLGGDSANVSAMQSEFDPGSQGSENLPSSVREEIRSLRFAIRRLLGETYWYDTPDITVSSINSLVSAGISFPKNRVDSGRVDANGQPMYLIPNGSAGVRLAASVTPFRCYINNTLVEVNSNVDLSGLSGPGSYTLAVNVAGLAGGQSSRSLGEETDLVVDTASGSAPTADSFQAWKIVSGANTEYFMAQFASSTALRKARRGYFFDSSDEPMPRIEISDDDVITLCRAAYIFFRYVSGTPSLEVTYNRPTVSYDAPTGPSSGDYWLDLNDGLWKKYEASTWINSEGLPVGIAVMDGSSIVGCRSMDFGRSFARLNTIRVEKTSASTVRVKDPDSRISVYGNVFKFDFTLPQWSMSSDLDSGVTEQASRTYYFYIKNNGDLVISDVKPYDRRFDLEGYYHPSKPWRAVGYAANDGSSNLGTAYFFQEVILLIQTDDIEDRAVTADKIQSDLPRSSLAAPNKAVSSASGSVTISSSTMGDVSNLSVSLTTTGRSVRLGLFPAGTSTGYLSVYANASADGNVHGQIQFLRGSTVVGLHDVMKQNGGTSLSDVMRLPLSAFQAYDTDPSAGTYTYKVQAKVMSTNDRMDIINAKLVAEEVQ